MSTFDWIQVIGPVAITAFLPLLGLLATPVGVPVLSWLVGSAPGRLIGTLGIVMMAVWLAYRIGAKDGVARVKAETKKRNLDALLERVAIDEDIRAMPPDRRREELAKWVR